MNSNNEQLLSLRETINQQHDLLKHIKDKNDEIYSTLEEMAQIKEPEHNNSPYFVGWIFRFDISRFLILKR